MKAGTEERRTWAIRHDRCWVCGAKDYRGFPLETHEMERRSQAPKRWMHKCNYFRACKICHMDDLAAMSHAKQLAYKYIYDHDEFDREGWLRLRDPRLKAPLRVTAKEIADKVMQLQEEGHPKWK